MTADSLPAFTIHKPWLADLAGMAELIPFPLPSRAALVRSIVDDLECVHGPAASAFWRTRIAGIVADMRSSGLSDAIIRNQILSLQDAVQAELCERGVRAKSQA
jgi:hypothetical protein